MNLAEKRLNKNVILQQIRAVASPSDLFIGLIMSSLFINILSLALPVMLLQIYDRIIPNAAFYTLFLLSSGVIFALLLEATLKMLRAYVTTMIDARLEHNLGYQAFSKILNAQITDYEVIGAGEYLEHLNAIRILKGFYSNQIIVSLLDLPFVVIFIGLMFYISSYLGFIPLIFLILLLSSAFILSHQVCAYLAAKHETINKRINFIISTLSGIHSIKSMALEMQMLRRYERIQEMACHHDFQLGLKGTIAQLISNSAAQLSTVVVLVFGSIMVVHGYLTIGGLAACVLLTNRALQPASRAIDILARLQAVKLVHTRLDDIAKLPQEKVDAIKNMPNIHGEVTLENMSFHYDKQKSWLFNHINLSIKTGKIIAIHGHSLAGKSSLLWLIMGIMQPVDGRILIDNRDIRQFDPQQIRKQIAYIPQKGKLFNGTILDNLTMFNTHSIERAKQIVEELGLTQDIQQLPLGYETFVGKLSVEPLPQGLSQRICIARALMNEPRIILFDEANVAMDARSDALLKAAIMLQRGQRTWIIVSRQPWLLKLADCTYVIKNAALEEIKHYDEATF